MPPDRPPCCRRPPAHCIFRLAAVLAIACSAVKVIPFLDPDGTVVPMAPAPGPAVPPGQGALKPVTTIDPASVPPLEPENPDALGEIVPGTFYEALDANSTWHVVVATKKLGEHRFDARVARYGAHVYGVQRLVAEKEFRKTLADKGKTAANTGNATEDSYFAQDAAAGHYKSIFEDRWPVVYEQYVRKIPIVNDPYPPKGFR
eukprot:g16181.t1